MITIPFIRGPFDGGTISISDRVPAEIHLSVECVDADANDPRFLEAITANLAPDELDYLIVARNLNEIIARYQLGSDDDGAQYYRFAGWLTRGVCDDKGGG